MPNKPREGRLYRELVLREPGGVHAGLRRCRRRRRRAPLGPRRTVRGGVRAQGCGDILDGGAWAVLLSVHGLCSWRAKGSTWSVETRPLPGAPCKQVRLHQSQNRRKRLDSILLPRAYFLFPGNCSWTLPVTAWWYLHVLLLWEYFWLFLSWTRLSRVSTLLSSYTRGIQTNAGTLDCVGKVLGNELEGHLDFWLDNWMLKVSFTEKKMRVGTVLRIALCETSLRHPCMYNNWQIFIPQIRNCCREANSDSILELFLWLAFFFFAFVIVITQNGLPQRILPLCLTVWTKSAFV